jgi:hypothetical protein
MVAIRSEMADKKRPNGTVARVLAVIVRGLLSLAVLPTFAQWDP